MCQTRFQTLVWGSALIIAAVVLIVIGSLSADVIVYPPFYDTNMKFWREQRLPANFEDPTFTAQMRVPSTSEMGLHNMFYNITNLPQIWASNGPHEVKINVQEVEVMVGIDVTCQWVASAVGEDWWGSGYNWCTYERDQKPGTQLDEYVNHVNPVFFRYLAVLHNEQWLGIWAGSQTLTSLYSYWGSYEGGNTRDWRNWFFGNFINQYPSTLYMYLIYTAIYFGTLNFDWNIAAFAPGGNPEVGLVNMMHYWANDTIDTYDNLFWYDSYQVYVRTGVSKYRNLEETFQDVCSGQDIGNERVTASSSFCYWVKWTLRQAIVAMNDPVKIDDVYYPLTAGHGMDFWLETRENGQTCIDVNGVGNVCLLSGSDTGHGIADGGINQWFDLYNRAITFANDNQATDWQGRTWAQLFAAYIDYFTKPANAALSGQGWFPLQYEHATGKNANQTLSDLMLIMNWMQGMWHRDALGLWVFIKNQVKGNIDLMYNAFNDRSWYNIWGDDRGLAKDLLTYVTNYELYGGYQWGSGRMVRYSEAYNSANLTGFRQVGVVDYDYSYEWFAYWNPTYLTIKHLMSPTEGLWFLFTFGNWENIKPFLPAIDWLHKLRCVAFDPCDHEKGCCPLYGGTTWCTGWGFQNMSTFWLNAQNTADVWEYLSFNMGFNGRMHGGLTRTPDGVYLANSGMFARHTIRELLMGYDDRMAAPGHFGIIPTWYEDEAAFLDAATIDTSGETGWTFYNGNFADGSEGYDWDNVNRIRSYNSKNSIVTVGDFKGTACTNWPSYLQIFNDCDVKFYNEELTLKGKLHEHAGAPFFIGLRTGEIPEYFDFFHADMYRFMKMECTAGMEKYLGFENGPMACRYVHPVFKANNHEDNYIEHEGIQPLYHVAGSIDYYVVKGHFFQAPATEAAKITGLAAPSAARDEAAWTIDPNIGIGIGSERLYMFMYRLRSFTLDHVIPWISDRGFEGARQWTYKVCNDTDDVCSTVHQPYLKFFLCDYVNDDTCTRDDVYIPFTARDEPDWFTESEAEAHADILNRLNTQIDTYMGTFVAVGAVFLIASIYCFRKSTQVSQSASATSSDVPMN